MPERQLEFNKDNIFAIEITLLLPQDKRPRHAYCKNEMAADGDDEQASLVRLAQELTGIVPRLQKLAARGALPAAARGTAWRLFLRVVPPQQPDRWAAAVAGKRATYDTLRAAAHAALHEAMAQALDDQNGGAEHGDDGDDAGAALEEAADQIRRDCERCYLEGAGDHFLEPARQQLMFGVLLTWAHAHPEPCLLYTSPSPRDRG